MSYSPILMHFKHTFLLPPFLFSSLPIVSSISLYRLHWHPSPAHPFTQPQLFILLLSLIPLHMFLFLHTSYLLFFPPFYSFPPFSSSSHPFSPSRSPSISVSPESLIWYLSGMGPINPARLCLFSPPLIRMHTGDILLLLVVGD